MQVASAISGLNRAGAATGRWPGGGRRSQRRALVAQAGQKDKQDVVSGVVFKPFEEVRQCRGRSTVLDGRWLQGRGHSGRWAVAACQKLQPAPLLPLPLPAHPTCFIPTGQVTQRLMRPLLHHVASYRCCSALQSHAFDLYPLSHTTSTLP